MRRGLLISGGTLLSMVLFLTILARSAEAVKPNSYHIEFEYSFTDPSLCGFPIVLSVVSSGTVWEFFDQDGNPIGAMVKVSDITAATNPANGESISGKSNWVNTIDFATYEQAVHGLFTKLTVPGAGVVVLDTGTVRLGPPPDYEVTFQAGPHYAYFEGDVAALCGALA